MDRPNKSEKDRVNIKLQKTISNLISNVISSLCQQVVQYERSIDIFGLLCINIDDDIDISVKLNEKFIKKEIVANNSTMDYSRLIETVQKKDTATKALQEIIGNGMEIEQSGCNDDMDIDGKENECPLLIDESEKCSLTQKRRPRKPQHTFRHVIVDELQNSKESAKPKAGSSISDNELKIDTQFEFKSSINNSNNVQKSHSKIINSGSLSKSNETDESDEKPCLKSIESIMKISPNSSVLNIDDSIGKIDNFHTVTKPTQSYKCTVCDRQFKRKFCLTRHKRVHQNYKSYLCNICGLGFDLVNQLKRHLRNAHACSRENLRRSCRNSQKSESTLKSPLDQFCPIECAWQMPKGASQLPLLPVKQISASANPSDGLTTKPVCFNQFSFPPGLIVANSGKKPSPSAFSQTFTSPTSVSTQYQVRQMFNSIMSASDGTMPYNNTLYYMQNYAHILPTAASNSLYHHSIANGNSQNSMPTLSSAPSTTNSMAITNSCSQRLPIYRFPPGLFTSPSLKSIPLPLNNNWNSNMRTADSNQPEKFKQSVSPITTSTTQLT